MVTLLAPFLNLLVLVAVLIYFLRQPVKTFVSQRHTSIRDELKNVREQLRAAQEKYEEFSAKLKAIEVEVSTIDRQVRVEVESMKQKILNDARFNAGAIVSDSKTRAATIFSDSLASIRAEIAAKVVDRAELLLRSRLTGDDRARIRKEFSLQIGVSR